MEVQKAIETDFSLRSSTPSKVVTTVETPASPVAVNLSNFVSKETHNKLKNELEKKKDELRQAHRKLDELSVQSKDTASLAKYAATKIRRNFLDRKKTDAETGEKVERKTEIGVDELRGMHQEIRMLQEALESNEEKVEVLTKESKVMKQILQQPQAFQISNLGIVLSNPSGDRAGRRLGELSIVGPESQSISPASVLHYLMIASHHHLMDQAMYWKKVAMHRLLDSLSVLDTPDLRKQLAEKYKQKSSLSILSASASADNARRSSAILDVPKEDTSVAGRHHLYRELRRARAEAVRVADIDTVGSNRKTKRAVGRSTVLLFRCEDVSLVGQ